VRQHAAQGAEPVVGLASETKTQRNLDGENKRSL